MRGSLFPDGTATPSAKRIHVGDGNPLPGLEPLRISMRSPRRSPTLSSRMASLSPLTTKTRFTPYRYCSAGKARQDVSIFPLSMWTRANVPGFSAVSGLGTSASNGNARVEVFTAGADPRHLPANVLP